MPKIDRTSPEYAEGGLVLPPGKRPGGLGRVVVKDRRDRKFAARAAVPPERWDAPTLPRFMWRVPGILDQGETSECTGFSAVTALSAQPYPHVHYSPQTLYREAKKRDAWEGEDYDGSSVRGAAKAAQALGEIARYRWMSTVDELRRGLRWLGVVVVGTDWTADMYRPDRDGLVRATGGVDGGHAYAVLGYDDAKYGGAFRIPNSWGTRWGQRGYCWVSYDDMAELLRRDGEACVYVKHLTAAERGHGDGTGRD